MSSYKQKKLKTLVTRKKTLARRRHADVGSVGGCDTDDGNAAPSVENTQLPSFIAMDRIESPREGYVFKMGARGLGLYRDTGDGDAGAATSGDDAEADVGLGWRVKESVSLSEDAEVGMENAIAAYRRVRARDGRQKARVVVVVGDTDKPLAKLPPRFGIPQLKTKAVSRLGVGSASKSKFNFAGVGLLHQKVDERAIRQLLQDFRSGKTWTIFVTDDCLHWLLPLAEKTEVLIQISKLPEVSLLQQRRRLLMGGASSAKSGVEQSSKRAYSFYSRPTKLGVNSAANVVVRQLAREGHDMSDFEPPNRA